MRKQNNDSPPNTETSSCELCPVTIGIIGDEETGFKPHSSLEIADPGKHPEFDFESEKWSGRALKDISDDDENVALLGVQQDDIPIQFQEWQRNRMELRQEFQSNQHWPALSSFVFATSCILFAGCQVLVKEFYRFEVAGDFPESLSPNQATMHCSGVIVLVLILFNNSDLKSKLWTNIPTEDVLALMVKVAANSAQIILIIHAYGHFELFTAAAILQLSPFIATSITMMLHPRSMSFGKVLVVILALFSATVVVHTGTDLYLANLNDYSTLLGLFSICPVLTTLTRTNETQNGVLNDQTVLLYTSLTTFLISSVAELAQQSYSTPESFLADMQDAAGHLYFLWVERLSAQLWLVFFLYGVAFWMGHLFRENAQSIYKDDHRNLTNLQFVEFFLVVMLDNFVLQSRKTLAQLGGLALLLAVSVLHYQFYGQESKPEPEPILNKVPAYAPQWRSNNQSEKCQVPKNRPTKSQASDKWLTRQQDYGLSFIQEINEENERVESDDKQTLDSLHSPVLPMIQV